MRRFVWVTGHTCAGKTRALSAVAEAGVRGEFASPVKVVSVGEAVRRSGAVFPEGEAAPASCEPYVLEAVRNAYFDAEDGTTTFVDGFPRSAAQLSALHGGTLYGDAVREVDTSHFVVSASVDLDTALRRNAERAGRSRSSEDVCRRWTSEKDFMTSYLKSRPGFTLIDVDASRGDSLLNVLRAFAVDGPSGSFRVVWEAHMAFASEATSHIAGFDRCFTAPDDDRVSAWDPRNRWLLDLVRAMQMELSEVERELQFKWWTTAKSQMGSVRRELVDVLHFFLTAASAAGFTPETLATAMLEKRAVNVARHRSGSYSGVGGDDAHVGNSP